MENESILNQIRRAIQIYNREKFRHPESLAVSEDVRVKYLESAVTCEIIDYRDTLHSPIKYPQTIAGLPYVIDDRSPGFIECRP